MVDDQLAGATVAGDDVDDAGGQADALDDLGEGDGSDGGELRRLEHDSVTGGQRRGDLPGEHEQREVPGDDLADDAERAHIGQLVREELRPASVMIEVAGDER